MRETIHHNLNKLLTRDRHKLSRLLRERVQRSMDRLETGIEIVDFQLKTIHPPLQVAGAFQRVISSALEKNTMIIKSKADAKRILAEAMATANNKIVDAKSAALLRYKRTLGEIFRFESLAKEYEKNPKEYKKRVLLEAKEKSLKEKRILVVDDEVYEGDVENWIKINQ